MIRFEVKFITPLLIHGSNSGEIDTIGLTGKALRGCWRFWFRAFTGGMVNRITKEKISELESKIFGSSDENAGAKFRMIVEPIDGLKHSATKIRFSNRSVDFNGYKEGSRFLVKIAPRSNMSDKEVKILLSSIWLWAHLGAIGQRARRGFGSPVIEFDGNSNPCEELNLSVKQKFNNTYELSSYLKEGLVSVWNVFNSWKAINPLSLNTPIYNEMSMPPVKPGFFIVSSFKQITVAEISVGKDVDTALNKIHGSNTCWDMGSANPRKASPVFIRLHKVNDEFYPIVTWSKPEKSGCARDYILKNCNCKKYLDGSPI